jgi:sugar phosphate permease
LATNYGWRAVSLTVAGVAFALIPLVALLLRDRPAEMGLPPYGGTVVETRVQSTENPAMRALRGLRDGMKYRDFWLLFGTFFVCGASTNGLIGTHLITACFDHGIPEVTAAGLLAMMGIFDFFGTTGSGWLTDRVDSRVLLFWYYGLRGLSLIFLPFAFDYTFYGLSVFAVFYGLDWIATVPPTVRLAEKSFGKQNAALMFGWIVVGHQIGGAFAAWGAGFIRTQTGDYLGAFIASGMICLAAAAVVPFIGINRKPERTIGQAAAV